jgi:RNA polymerase primary sigma factor
MDKVADPGDVAERTLSFRIPTRIDRKTEGARSEVVAGLTLRLRLAGTGDSPELQNHVALVRGSGMVVRYRPVRVSLGGYSYHAVLYAGLARGESEADRALEEFLRAAEPPSHIDWTHATDRLRAEYRQGAQARLNRLWRELESSIVEICEERPVETDQGPAKLAELFPVSGQGDGIHTRRGMFRVDRLDAWLEDGTWRLSGRVRRLMDDGEPWGFTIVSWLDAETGPGEVIRIEEFQVEGGQAYTWRNGWKCDVPPEEGRVRFTGRTDPRDPDTIDIHRTRLRLQVQARSSEEHGEP